MSYLIIGASSGLGKDLAYTFAKNKKNLVVCSRDERDLNALKSDLEIKYNITVKAIKLDISLVDNLEKSLNLDAHFFSDLEGMLFPVGMMFDQDNLSTDTKNTIALINSNFVSITHIISKFYQNSNDKEFSIIGFGSVSGYLGRQLNVNYAAAKRALESYFESLAFLSQTKKTYVQFYILGYLDTNLSFGKNLKLPKGSTKKLSEKIYKNKKIKFKKFYYPAYWILIVKLLQFLPFKFLLTLNKLLK